MIEMVIPACSIPQSVPPMLVSWRALARTSGSVKVDAAVHDDQRAEEFVPRGDEGEQRDRDDRRPDRRHVDAHQHLPAGAAVDHRRFLEFARHRLEAVAHDVDAERDLDRGVDDREADQRVGQPQRREHEEDRREQRLVGDDQGEEQEDEEELLARDREARQRIAGGNGQRRGRRAIVRKRGRRRC